MHTNHVTPLIIANDGERIANTNFWETVWAQNRSFFLSWNAGTGRLLVPDCHRGGLREMATAKYVIISRGPWKQQRGVDALELLFEDGSDNPYYVFIGTDQTDRLLSDYQQGGGFDVTIWTRDGESLRLPGKYRKVPALPCLRSWEKH